VHAKLLQKEKEIMSMNYTATISMNYTTREHGCSGCFQYIKRISENAYEGTDFPSVGENIYGRHHVASNRKE